jgi:hypothetical protein
MDHPDTPLFLPGYCNRPADVCHPPCRRPGGAVGVTPVAGCVNLTADGKEGGTMAPLGIILALFAVLVTVGVMVVVYKIISRLD